MKQTSYYMPKNAKRYLTDEQIAFVKTMIDESLRDNELSARTKIKLWNEFIDRERVKIYTRILSEKSSYEVEIPIYPGHPSEYFIGFIIVDHNNKKIFFERCHEYCYDSYNDYECESGKERYKVYDVFNRIYKKYLSICNKLHTD